MPVRVSMPSLRPISALMIDQPKSAARMMTMAFSRPRRIRVVVGLVFSMLAMSRPQTLASR